LTVPLKQTSKRDS